MYGEIFIYVPTKNQIIRIEEGTGENLLREDIAAGYVDYINYEQYLVEQGFPDEDGGMVMLKSLFRDIYASTVEAIPDVLLEAYGDSKVNYILLERKDENE